MTTPEAVVAADMRRCWLAAEAAAQATALAWEKRQEADLALCEGRQDFPLLDAYALWAEGVAHKASAAALAAMVAATAR
jgi:hypothetical protein